MTTQSGNCAAHSTHSLLYYYYTSIVCTSILSDRWILYVNLDTASASFLSKYIPLDSESNKRYTISITHIESSVAGAKEHNRGVESDLW